MKNWVLLSFLLMGVSCTLQPQGKDYIYTQKDDHLSLQGKVSLLKESSSIDDDALLSAISLLYAQNENWVEAKDAISKAIKLNPINSTYHLYLANYNAELANNIEAYEEAKVALELGSYDKKLEALLARMALETGDSVNSKTFVTTYYLANKNNIEAQLLMARLYLLEEKYATANSMVLEILTRDSTNFDALKVAYQSYSALDSLPLAIYYGVKLIEFDSLNTHYYFELGNMYLRKNNLLQSANFYAKSYRQLPLLSSLYLVLGNYNKLALYDSIIFYTDSLFTGVNNNNKHVLLMRARAFDQKYKYDDAFLVYNSLVKMDSSDSVVNAERALVQRKITYLWRKKREQQQLVDSLANLMPTIKF